MESDASWLTDGGTESGGCCLNVTLRDYGRLGLFMMEGGSAGGAGVVPAGWIGEATTSKSSPGETPYGYQWWIPSPGIYAALGIFGQTIYIDPAKDLVRSEEHTSELQSLMRISYAVFCLKKKTKQEQQTTPARPY